MHRPFNSIISSSSKEERLNLCACHRRPRLTRTSSTHDGMHVRSSKRSIGSTGTNDARCQLSRRHLLASQICMSTSIGTDTQHHHK